MKAGFDIVPGAAMRRAPPGPLIRRDVRAGPRSSLVAASDLSPYKPLADVLLQGRARAPGGVATPGVVVRLAVSRDDRPALDKKLVVRGESSPSGTQPFVDAPVVYELAPAGPDGASPLGVPPGTWARIVHPRALDRPAGFGPIDPAWPARARLLPEGLSFDAAMPTFPDDFPWSYFQAAPRDQVVAYLRGDEWIAFEGFAADSPRIASCLPRIYGTARLHRPPPAPPEGEAIALVADTLVIDADNLRCTVVFRGRFPVMEEDELPVLRVVAGIGDALNPIVFPDSAAAITLPGTPEGGTPEGSEPEAPTQRPAIQASRPALPFVAPGAPQPPARPGLSPETPPASTQRAPLQGSSAPRPALPFVKAPAAPAVTPPLPEAPNLPSAAAPPESTLIPESETAPAPALPFVTARPADAPLVAEPLPATPPAPAPDSSPAQTLRPAVAVAPGPALPFAEAPRPALVAAPAPPEAPAEAEDAPRPAPPRGLGAAFLAGLARSQIVRRA